MFSTLMSNETCPQILPNILQSYPIWSNHNKPTAQVPPPAVASAVPKELKGCQLHRDHLWLRATMAAMGWRSDGCHHWESANGTPKICGESTGSWLVVYLPLWKIWKSVGMIIPNIWKNNPNVPNHQPVSQYWRIKESKIKVTKECKTDRNMDPNFGGVYITLWLLRPPSSWFDCSWDTVYGGLQISYQYGQSQMVWLKSISYTCMYLNGKLVYK